MFDQFFPHMKTIFFMVEIFVGKAGFQLKRLTMSVKRPTVKGLEQHTEHF